MHFGSNLAAPLIKHFSNGHFRANLDSMQAQRDATIPVRIRPELCRRGCGQSAAVGRKYLSQGHYDHSKGMSPDEAEEALALFRQGVSAKRLAREYQIAHTTVYRLLRKHKLI
jgi:Helix-turn-helix domain of resolvase